MNDEIEEALKERILKLRIANESRYWGHEHIAVVLNRSVSQVRRRIIDAPGFPAPMEKEQSDGSMTKPLYLATDVQKWIESGQATRLSS